MTTRHEMIQHGQRAVAAAAPDYKPVHGDQEQAQTALADALTSIRHWADWNGVNWNRGLLDAAHHYHAERRFPLHEETRA